MALASASATSRTSILSSHARTPPSPKLQKLRAFHPFPTPGLHCNPFSLSHQARLSSIPCASPSIASSPIPRVEVPESTTDDTWREFARNISGEWDGFGADFSSEGKPIELPESVVPEAYREWEVKVFDWQTQCPTLANAEERILDYKTIKLLPTVGCEADAATRYSVDERYVGEANGKAAAFAYQSSGCYVSVWPTEDKVKDKMLEVEFCLINPLDRESRVRITQVIHVSNNKVLLKGVRVFCEQWYGPFRNGDQLGGCAIRDSAFASTPATAASDVLGVWQGPTSTANFHSSQDKLLELMEVGVQRLVRDDSNLVLLPKQLWCSLRERENGETCSEAGWLFDNGRAITSRCILSRDAEAKNIQVDHDDICPVT
ncbi:uncharacterized protein LOC115681577 isoform X2 [Syzygium oleosum]|uniref:uncharacterized protein LOC115681577 isoform X2 n=1 Tax=Syzygium oleosum TaxID=219896 RepID=UPI0024BB303D|nr:uncharacterized protein LOC115681577 isoform X2 [Syzygium oleosum]XP_056164808.1 uncharacterized protein LOC115681577 isoform X2 [Syzygium oleosum]